MALFKISPEAMAAVGATKEDEFGAKLVEFLQSTSTATAAFEAKLNAATAELTALKQTITASTSATDAKISALGTREEIINAATLSAKSTAETAANNKTTEILGAVGINPQVPANPVAPKSAPAAYKPFEQMSAEERSKINWTEYARQTKAQAQIKTP